MIKLNKFQNTMIYIVIAILSILVLIKWSYFFGNGAEALRNIVLPVAAIAALPLVIWRNRSADKQVETMQKQVEETQNQLKSMQDQVSEAQKQSQIAEDGLRHDRYQKGASMLGSTNLMTRIGGIYALDRLAKEFPGLHHGQIMDLIAAFVRHWDHEPTHSTDAPQSPMGSAECPPDVKAAVQAIGNRSYGQIDHELQMEVHDDVIIEIDFSRANLSGIAIAKLDLSGANMWQVNLSYADLQYIDLTNSSMTDARMVGACLRAIKMGKSKLKYADFSNARLFDIFFYFADLANADFTNASFENVILTGACLDAAVFHGVEGLTQAMLDSADRGTGIPPDLGGAVCAETGESLVWKQNLA